MAELVNLLVCSFGVEVDSDSICAVSKIFYSAGLRCSPPLRAVSEILEQRLLPVPPRHQRNVSTARDLL